MPARFAPAFERYVAPARRHAEIWRTFLGLCLIGVIYVGWVYAAIRVYHRLAVWLGRSATLDQMAQATTPADTLALLSTFLGMALGPILIVRLLHHRPIGSLFGRASIVLRDFCVAALLVGLVYGLSFIPWAWRFDAVPRLDPATWLLVLPLAMLGLLIQTGAEELVFRGYLQQQLAARFRWRIVWLVLPSLIFGAAHYDPAVAGGNVWLVIGATAMFGLAAADLTSVTGSIGAAWGFHFANNFAAILILATKGTIPGLALFTTPYSAQETDGMAWLFASDMVTLFIAWALVRRALQN
ncbi:MAG: CPBP family intramembrane metalloprotease [Rhodobacter sp.]|nr:CPBP family intramembrane metalloprotease [Rhodobacter sp.]